MDLVKTYREALQEIVDGYRFGRYPDSITFAEKTIKRTADLLDVREEALQRIMDLDPAEDSEEGYNEWGEADCFGQAQNIADQTLLEVQHESK